MVNVEEVWKSVLPAETRLLAAAGQLDHSVSWVLVLRPRTGGLGSPRGDEMVLLSTQTLTSLGTQLSLARAIQDLAGKACALAVRGDVPADAVQEAERCGMPLFLLPDSISLTALERDILHYLSEQRTEWYRRKHSLLHDLTALAGQGRGWDALAQHMSGAAGQAVLFQDETGEVLAYRIPDSFPPAKAEAVLAAAQEPLQEGPHSTDPIPLSAGLGRLTVGVMMQNVQAGTVSLIGPIEALGSDDRQVLEAGATVGAIEFAREHAVQETVHRIHGDFVSDLLDRTADDLDLERRARRMGHDPDAVRVAITFYPTAQNGHGSSPSRETLSRLAQRVARALKTYDVEAPIHVDETMVAAFYPLGEDTSATELKRLAERLRRDVTDAVRGHRLYLGISRCHAGIDGFRSAMREARRAVEVGRALAPDRAATYFGDLGVYRLLFSMRETDEMQEFYDDLLGPLVRYDREKNKELVRTLEAYLLANNATEVAARLSLHRNSLLYRLRRIREIAGLDLDDPETRLALHLALRIGETLRTDLALRT